MKHLVVHPTADNGGQLWSDGT